MEQRSEAGVKCGPELMSKVLDQEAESVGLLASDLRAGTSADYRCLAVVFMIGFWKLPTYEWARM